MNIQLTPIRPSNMSHATQAFLIKKTITIKPIHTRNEVNVDVSRTGVSYTTFLAKAICMVDVAA
ncbi:MAG: hypothetical protein AAFN93_07350 [Bacteroidota bacterium]